MEKKFREFTVHKVLPENGTPHFWAAEEGDRFVEQDSWIGEQFHVIEHAAFTELLEIAEKIDSAIYNYREHSQFTDDDLFSVIGLLQEFKKKAGIE